MHVAAYFPEAIFFVEAATGRVLFEHIELNRLANASCMVHQLLTDSPSVMLGIDLVADERDDLKSVVLVLSQLGLGSYLRNCRKLLPSCGRQC